MAKSCIERLIKFSLPLSEAEHAYLSKDAYELGLSKADYVRTLIIKGHVVGQHPYLGKEESAKLLSLIEEIGNNINYLAYESVRDYGETWDTIYNECLKILSIIGKLPTKEMED